MNNIKLAVFFLLAFGLNKVLADITVGSGPPVSPPGNGGLQLTPPIAIYTPGTPVGAQIPVMFGAGTDYSYDGITIPTLPPGVSSITAVFMQNGSATAITPPSGSVLGSGNYTLYFEVTLNSGATLNTTVYPGVIASFDEGGVDSHFPIGVPTTYEINPTPEPAQLSASFLILAGGGLVATFRRISKRRATGF